VSQLTERSQQLAPLVASIAWQEVEASDPRLLQLCLLGGLSTSDIENDSVYFVAAEGQVRRACACFGLQIEAVTAVLKKVVVAPSLRGRGLGTFVVDEAMDRARKRGARDVYLLTDSAETFFSRHGFASLERCFAPPMVKESSIFTDLCARATVMKREL